MKNQSVDHGFIGKLHVGRSLEEQPSYSVKCKEKIRTGKTRFD